LECVKDLATSININDYQMLLENIDGVNNKLKLNERQVTAVKKIYDICIWFLTEFECTHGFNDYWYTLKKEGIVNDKNDVIEFVDKMHGKIGLILDQEYFDLRDTDIYNELCEFVCDDLVDIYDGKLSCGYRYEAFEYEKDTTSDDYNKAMIKLNGIIEKYV
jgi:hypothetical protein